MKNSALLIADIGGTKSDVALFNQSDVRTPTHQQRFINTQYSGIDEILTQFRATVGELPAVACFAVAGVMQENSVQMTNLPWRIDVDELKEIHGFTEVVLVNDLTAVASSIRYLDVKNSREIKTILKGGVDGGNVTGVVAPGTGLGEGFVVEWSGHYFVSGCEGGHTGFAPVGEEQMALLTWAHKQFESVSYETLIAGPGLARLYDFCKSYHGITESETVTQAMAKSNDSTPAIIAGVTGLHPCTLCKKVVDLFLNILGSEAGNLALKLYAKGGIYLGGGILPRLVDHVSFDGFRDSFLNKGDMSPLMKEIPVRMILDKNAALVGAAGYLLEYLEAKSGNR